MRHIRYIMLKNESILKNMIIKMMVIILIALIALKVGTIPLKSKDEPLKPFKFELIVLNLMKRLFKRK